jgi:hypothetical protein
MRHIAHHRAWLPRLSVVPRLLEEHAIRLAAAWGRSNAGWHWNPGLVVNDRKEENLFCKYVLPRCSLLFFGVCLVLGVWCSDDPREYQQILRFAISFSGLASQFGL